MTGPAMRIDKWLWQARLVKTRSAAARLCAEGQVEIGDTPALRPAQALPLGATVTLTHAGGRRRVRVLGHGTRRGPAAEAALLYEDTAPAERLGRAEPGWTELVAEPE